MTDDLLARVQGDIMRLTPTLLTIALVVTACADGPTPVTPEKAPVPVARAAPAVTSDGGKVDADLIKKAATVGYFPRTRGGVAVFCRTDSDVGTRFTTEKCINESQLAEVVLRMREVQDNMRKGGACTTPNCGN
jgi:hypothetical protein